MLIIGVDYHPSDQYTAFADTETGECGERRLNHSEGEAEKPAPFSRAFGRRQTIVYSGLRSRRCYAIKCRSAYSQCPVTRLAGGLRG